MRYFPAFLDLAERTCLVVGGGAAAVRKVRLLRKAGAVVRVVAPRVDPELTTLAEQGELSLIRRGFVAGDVRGCAVVHAATGLAEVDGRVADAASRAGVPVNVVDRAEISSFIVPAIVDRDLVVVGISTGGAAPVLARRLRAQIETLLPARLGSLARFAETFRASVAALLPAPAARLRFWERFFDGAVAEDVLAGRGQAAGEKMLSLVNRAGGETPEGLVSIVGAGPGDPELLTLKALRALERADVVVYDKLVNPDILDYARRDAERIYVGKSRGHHMRTQAQINDLLVAHARLGKRVVRLKGGDPFVFGRGGEERTHLRRHGIQVELVPGITAATGCGAATGIPLTHRAHAAAVTFVTGQGRNGEPDVDWAALARSRHTLVVYMGVAAAGRIADRLIAHGLAADTPVAVIENGTLATQKTVIGHLGALADLIHDHVIAGPAVIVVGEVVTEAESGAIWAEAAASDARALAG
jgi:uroporphyrin-III C-methyltransferase/precorrin-2 dehydrogenase/sirohydrochlorin ferrochelatase